MTPLFGYENLAVLSGDNPKLVELSEEHDSVIQQFDELNEEITSEQVTQEPGPEEERRYNDYENRVNKLQIRMLEWEAKAKSFIQYPSLTFASIGQLDDHRRREMKDHVVNVVSMLRGDMAQSRLVLTNNYQHLISDAETAIIKRRSQESIDVAKESNRLATESHKIAEKARISSAASKRLGVKSYRLALAGVLLALVGIAITIWLSTPSNSDLEQEPASSASEIIADSSAQLLVAPVDTTTSILQIPSMDSTAADSLRDSTLIN